MQKREIEPSQALVKLYADGGGGTFKLGLGVINTENYFKEEGVKRNCYSQGICPEIRKETSANKTLIIGIVPDMKENYENCQTVWTKAGLSDLSYKLCADLKLLNIIVGLQSNSSKHPCCFCNKRSDLEDFLFESGELRTLGSIRSSRDAWILHGQKDLNLKEFDNCQHLPLIEGHDGTRIIDVCSIPELHIFQGCTNILWNNLSNRWGTEGWEPFLIKHGLFRAKYHGGEFEGPQCKRLLSLSDELRDDLPEHLRGFCDAFDALDVVSKSMFGKQLSWQFEEDLKTFKHYFVNLNISSRSTKLHILFSHVGNLCNETGFALGLTSEQAGESLHAKFAEVARYRLPRDYNHHTYNSELMKIVLSYNQERI